MKGSEGGGWPFSDYPGDRSGDELVDADPARPAAFVSAQRAAETAASQAKACHFADIPSQSLLKRLLKGEGGVQQNDTVFEKEGKRKDTREVVPGVYPAASNTPATSSSDERTGHATTVSCYRCEHSRISEIPEPDGSRAAVAGAFGTPGRTRQPKRGGERQWSQQRCGGRRR